MFNTDNRFIAGNLKFVFYLYKLNYDWNQTLIPLIVLLNPATLTIS